MPRMDGWLESLRPMVNQNPEQKARDQIDAQLPEWSDELARSGAAILMVSSELAELIQVADRILVMRQGRIAGELPGRSSQEAVMRLATLEEQAQ